MFPFVAILPYALAACCQVAFWLPADSDATTKVYVVGTPQKTYLVSNQACCLVSPKTGGVLAAPVGVNPLSPAVYTVRAPAVLAVNGKAAGLVWTSEDEPSGVWIGVRLSPVPAPLAAHVGDSGLMIANIVTDSPADKAGLERYDIIVSFNARTVDDTDELVKAIQDAGAGKRVRMEILRTGKKQQVRIRPAQRRDDDSHEYKFDEPKTVENLLQFRGKALQRDDQGNWVLEDLGDLLDLPEALRGLEAFKGLQGLHTIPFGGALKLDHLPGLKFGFPNNTFQYRFDTDDLGLDGDARIEIKIKSSDEEGSISITRDADGKITVERVDEDGNESSATYDNADELEQDDADAFRMFNRFSGRGLGIGPRGNFLHLMPNFKILRGKQQRFQALIEKHVEKAREHAERAREHAGKMRKILLRRGDLDDEDFDFESGSEMTSILLDSDGHLVVVIKRDGDTKRYEFDSWEEFEQAEPELFEKLKIHVDRDDDD